MLCQTPRLACRVAFPLWTPGWHSIWLSAAAASWRVPLRFHDSTAGRIRSVKLQTGTYTCLSYISSYSLSSSKHWEFVWFRQILGGLCTWNCGVTYIFSGGNAKVKGQNFAFWNSLTVKIDEACWFMNSIWFPHYYSHLHCPIRNKIISLYWHFPALWSCTMQTSIFPYDPQLHISTLRQLIEIHIKPPPSTWTIFKFSFCWPWSSTQANVYFPSSPSIQHSTSSLHRNCRCVHQPTWTTPYARYISCWLTRRGWSLPLRHKSGCESHCLNAHRGQPTHK